MLRAKVFYTASVLATRAARHAGASGLGLVTVMPGGPSPIDAVFLAVLPRQPA